MESSPIETPVSTETTALPGDGKLKRPTGLTSTFGYRTKPRPATGLKIIIGFTVAVALAMGIRALASEDGGPIMQAINYVGGWFTGPTAK